MVFRSRLEICCASPTYNNYFLFVLLLETKKMSRTLIHKCDLILAKDNIAYMTAILGTHSRLFGYRQELDTEGDPAFKTKNPNILAKPYYCKEGVGDVLPLDPKILFP